MIKLNYQNIDFSDYSRRISFNFVTNKFLDLFFEGINVNELLTIKFSDLIIKIKEIEENIIELSNDDIIQELNNRIRTIEENDTKYIKNLKEIIIQNPLPNEYVNFNENQKKVLFYECNKIIKKQFDYENKYQKNISKYFEKELPPTTCYYCNIDFINVYSKSYKDILDFLNNAPIDEIMEIPGIGKETAEIIKKKQKTITTNWKRELNLTLPKEKKLEKFDISYIKPRNCFTLDHVLPKENYPYFALSLFNLLPSCYVCNSKLKKSNQLGIKSPTDNNFDFHEKVKFKIFLSNKNNQIQFNKPNSIDLYLKSINNEFDDYIKIFNLNERYSFHKYKVIEMINKRNRYPDTRIQELANITNQSFDRVKMDLFGEYLFDDDLSKFPLSKLTKDIAEELGLI